MLALSLGVQAHAEPSTSDIEKQIDAQWNQLEPVIEEHNKVQSDLAANKAKVDALQQQIQPLQEQIDGARSKVAELAVNEYKTGRASTLNALLASRSSDGLGDRLVRLESLARKQEDALAQVLALKKQYEEVKLPLDQLVAKLATQEADLAKRKAGIDAEIKKLNDMRLAAFGTTGGKGNLQPAPCPATYPGGPASVAARTACAQIGKPYVFGATGPGSFDCSGITMFAWKAAGVNLRHYTQWQYQDTKRVSREELRPGDLVFYYGDLHHMGMYVGNGWLLHAPTSGDVVRMKRMDDGPIAGFGRPG
ncbi:C40 family peptidase [Virgisporangium aurantiacum]|nr:NlpC/P60 family protein [Virgisporangium aurantiacum]